MKVEFDQSNSILLSKEDFKACDENIASENSSNSSEFIEDYLKLEKNNISDGELNNKRDDSHAVKAKCFFKNIHLSNSYLNRSIHKDLIQKNCNSIKGIFDYFLKHREELKTDDLTEIINCIKKISENIFFTKNQTSSSLKKPKILIAENIEDKSSNKKDSSKNEFEEIDDTGFGNDEEIRKIKWKKFCKDNIFSKNEFYKIMTDITRNIDKFTHDEILSILENLNKLEFSDNSFFKLAETILVKNIFAFDLHQLCTLTCILAKKSSSFKLLLNEIVLIVSQKSAIMNTKDLASIAFAFSNSRFKSVQFLSVIFPSIQLRLNEFNGKELSLVMYTYSKHDKICDETFLEKCCDLFLSKYLENATLSSILRFIWAAEKITIKNTDYLNKAENYLTPHIRYLSGRSISTIVHLYSRSSAGSHAFFIKLRDQGLRTYTKMTPQGLSSTLHGLSITLGRTLDSSGNIDSKFHETVETHVIKTLKNFDLLDISATVYSYCLIGCGSLELYEGLKYMAIQNASEFSSDCISKILYSFSLSRVCMSILKVFELPILERIHQFTLHALCDICWSFSVGRVYEKHFWETLLSLIPPRAVMNDERCCLLYPALIDAYIAIPSLQPQIISDLKQSSRGAFWDYQLKEFPSAFASDVKNVLSINFPRKYVQTSYDFDGILIDVALFDKENRKLYAIMCHTSLTIQKSTNKPRGMAVLKYRNLRRQGIEVINLFWESWRELDGVNKVELIHEKSSIRS